jgi:nucleoside-diphosphate-sugar epimerase
VKAFVTGATGFVGSHIAERLIATGWEVAALVRSPDRPSWLDAIPGAKKIRGSLAARATLEDAVKDADCIVHCAGLVKARSEAEYFGTNVEGTRTLLDAALAACRGLKRFVHISSQAAHGPAPDGRPVSEDAPPAPITPYGRSKLESERVVLARKDDIPVTVIRPPAVYGPRDRDIFIYFKLAARGIVPIVGAADRRLSLVYVKDLARAAVDAAQSERAAGETYFITSGHHDWNELSAAVARAVGRGRRLAVPAFVLVGAAWIAEAAGFLSRRAVTLNRHKAREILQKAWLCSHERAADHFGYEPEWGLDRGMAETASWYRKEGWIK